MSKYKLISEYYLKGNNRTQIATLCDCSRMTVWRVLQRVNAIGIGIGELSGMSEKELAYLLFPERAKPGDGYLIPDFKWEEFQVVKHRSLTSKRKEKINKQQVRKYLKILKKVVNRRYFSCEDACFGLK